MSYSVSCPVVTDATSSSIEQLHEAISFFLADNPETVKFERASGGVNNACYFVETATGSKYLLRIYNNGCNSPRVVYEHEVLRQLAPKTGTLSFRIPNLIPSIKDGATHVVLKSGTEACLFDRIEGGAAGLICYFQEKETIVIHYLQPSRLPETLVAQRRSWSTP